MVKLVVTVRACQACAVFTNSGLPGDPWLFASIILRKAVSRHCSAVNSVITNSHYPHRASTSHIGEGQTCLQYAICFCPPLVCWAGRARARRPDGSIRSGENERGRQLRRAPPGCLAALGRGRATIKRPCGKGATVPRPEVEQLLAGAGYPQPETAKRPGPSERRRFGLA